VKLPRLTWQYAATIAWLVFTVALASWWLIFALGQAQHLGALEGPESAQVGRVTRMLILEGVILVAMLVGGGVALLFAIRLEQQRPTHLPAFLLAVPPRPKTQTFPADRVVKKQIPCIEPPGMAAPHTVVSLMSNVPLAGIAAQGMWNIAWKSSLLSGTPRGGRCRFCKGWAVACAGLKPPCPHCSCGG